MGSGLHPPRAVLALQVTAAIRAVGERKFTTTTPNPGIKGTVPCFSSVLVARWVCSLGDAAADPRGWDFYSFIKKYLITTKILDDYLKAIIF